MLVSFGDMEANWSMVGFGRSSHVVDEGFTWLGGQSQDFENSKEGVIQRCDYRSLEHLEVPE